MWGHRLTDIQTIQAYDVVSVGRLAQGGKWRTEAMRSYSRPVLIWFTKGQGRITISGIKRGYGAHNAIFLPAGTMHAFDILGHVHGNVLFMPDDPKLGLPDDVVHLRIRDARRQAELTGMVEQMAQEIDRKDEGSARALDALAGLLAVWLSRQDELRDPDVTDLNATNRLVSAYASLLERDFRQPKSVSAYAAELGVTSTHLSRVCKQALGVPASDLRADRLHLEARRLLRETDMAIKDVARELGFASAAYFTRAFTRAVGDTPSHFRKSGTTIPA